MAIKGGLAPALAYLLLVGSIVIGLAFATSVGFGYLPAMGGEQWSLDGFRQLFADPRLWPSLAATLTAGALSTIAAFVTALGLTARLDLSTQDGRQNWSHRLAVAILAMPHVAMALGLAFLLAPSGWIMRGVEAITGWFPLPPDWQLVPDSHGLALALGLFLKETPFLFIAMVTAVAQLKPAPQRLMASTLGYDGHVGWMKIVLPQLYPLIRFPLLAVLAYGLSVVDMALLLGPSTPPTLPVLILRWANDPDFQQHFLAGAAALLQLALVAGAILLWWAGEWVLKRSLRSWLTNGARHWARLPAKLGHWLLGATAGLGTVLLVSCLLSLLVWSMADAWRYPDLLPQAMTLSFWQGAATEFANPLGHSLVIAIAVTLLAMILAVACLDHEKELRVGIVRRAEKTLFLPLLVPEVSFLLGLQVVLLLLGLNGSWPGVLVLHLLFVFPYVFLTLKAPWRAFDRRYEIAARALGSSSQRVFWRIKLPMLRGAIAWSAAIGCSVSLSLYLPTVLGGEGRIATLATEAVALSAGGDRRIVGVYGILQTSVSAMFFLLALLALRRRRWVSA